MLKRFIRYAMNEIRTADDYIKTAKICKDETNARYFHEMAKEEIKHFNIIMTIINNVLKEKNENEVETEEEIGSMLYELYNEWFKDVDTKVKVFRYEK